MARPIDILIDSAKESLLFSGVAIAVAFLSFWIIGMSYLDSFGFALLLEACGLMLVGGAMEFTSTGVIRRFLSIMNRRVSMDPADMKKQMSGAVLYTVTGIILFLESLVVALVLSV